MKDTLHFERSFSVPPEVLWPWVTDPVQMSRWSTARIIGREPGDGGRFDSVGATRTVKVPVGRGRTAALQETIEVVEPARTLVYRVVDDPLIRYHRGEKNLVAEDGGTQFTWHVEFRFSVPGLKLLMIPALRREINQSLDVLERLVQAEDVPTMLQLPPAPPQFDEDLDALFAVAERVLAEQRQHAEQLTRAGDRKRWFPLVYQYVTEEQIRRAREGLVQHPGWVLHLVEVFHQYYWRNFEGWSDESAHPERHWRIAFGAMEKPRDERTAMFLGLHRAIVAHIEQDLPRALAEVYVDHYASYCDYDRFRADYLLMGDVFAVASRRAMAAMDSTDIPWQYRVVQRLLPFEAETVLQEKLFYDVAGKRRQTFERGKAFADTLQRRNTASPA